MPTGRVASRTMTPATSSRIYDDDGAVLARVRGAQRGWWLEDAVPGTTIYHPGGRTINEGEHVWLAWLTHNISDVHGNADAAAHSEWGQPLVLGMLTAAVVVGLAAPADGSPEAVSETWSDGWRAIRLEGPVVAGDTLKAESRIVGVSDDAAGTSGLVTRTVIGRNQRSEVVVRIEEARTVLGRSFPES
jgi:acyl dehydratase